MSNIAINQGDEEITLSSPLFSAPQAAKHPWHIRMIDANRLMLERSSVANDDPGEVVGSGYVTAEFLFSLLDSFVKNQWTGVARITIRDAVKRIYFRNGQIISARSASIDDRLGEVLYRRGIIRIDELSEISAQVNRERKFGQLLLATGRYSHNDLWNALREQIIEIIRTSFFEGEVGLELRAGSQTLHSEMRLGEDTSALLLRAYNFSVAVREFNDRLSEESEIEILEQIDSGTDSSSLSDFYSDLIQLGKSFPRLDDFLRASKLSEIYTVAALMELVDRGLCRVHHLRAPHRHSAPELALLRSRIDTYSILLEKLRLLCTAHNLSIPVSDLAEFCQKNDHLDNFEFPILLQENGEISNGSIRRMLAQASLIPAVRRHYEIMLDALTCFLMQSLADILPGKSVGEVRNLYQSLL